MLLDRVARPALQSRRSRDKSRRLGQALGTRVNHSIAYPALLLELDPASATMLRQIVIEGLMLTIGPHGDRPANSGSRSRCPFADRNSNRMFCPSTYPKSRSPCRNSRGPFAYR